QLSKAVRGDSPFGALTRVEQSYLARVAYAETNRFDEADRRLFVNGMSDALANELHTEYEQLPPEWEANAVPLALMAARLYQQTPDILVINEGEPEHWIVRDWVRDIPTDHRAPADLERDPEGGAVFKLLRQRQF